MQSYEVDIDHPSHYTQGGIECIDCIESSMSREAFFGYLKGNILKYLFRYEKKAEPLRDLLKAQWYLRKLIEELKIDTDADLGSECECESERLE